MAKTKGYSATAKSLHWLIVVLLAAQFTVAWLMPHIGRNTPVTTLISLHFLFGVIILLIAIIRLAWRATHAEPAPLDGVPPWQVQSAKIIHWLLYLLLLVLPILGWINASWRGMPIVMFGLELPKLVGTRAPGWGWTGDVHMLIAYYVMLTLIGLRRVRSLPLFHSSRPCFAANASRRVSFRASPSPSASSPPRSVRAHALRAPRFCALPPGPCK